MHAYLWYAVIAGILYLVYAIFFKKIHVPPIPAGPFRDTVRDPTATTRGWYDIAIVGAGPSGATAAYFLAKAGVHTLLLEKKQFPRDKHCGDAVCKTAIEILMQMGIYERLLSENKAKIADSGGFVSPSGMSFVGASHKVLGAVPAAIAIKRTDLDEAIARNAQKTGADLKENCTVVSATFDEKDAKWNVKLEDGTVYRARVLVCADGAPSKLARDLGIVKREPDGVCSRQFIEGKTHSFGADGVVFYNRELLPGYAAIFKHPNDELNYCTYLIPGNPKVQNGDIKKWHDFLLTDDPAVKTMMGPGFRALEPMKAGPLRLGGEPCSFMKHCMVIGDAAGMIDPMTGEGIHHAMDSGRICAQTMLDAMAAGNYSHFETYHARWMREFGFDFVWSMRMCQLVYRYPILLDACVKAVQRKGNDFLAKWAEIMTGRVPKIHLLHPQFAVVIGYELTVLLIKKYVFGQKITDATVIGGAPTAASPVTGTPSSRSPAAAASH